MFRSRSQQRGNHAVSTTPTTITKTIRHAWNQSAPVLVLTDLGAFPAIDYHHYPDPGTSLARWIELSHDSDYNHRKKFLELEGASLVKPLGRIPASGAMGQ